jgi:hypothetical protein
MGGVLSLWNDNSFLTHDSTSKLSCPAPRECIEWNRGGRPWLGYIFAVSCRIVEYIKSDVYRGALFHPRAVPRDDVRTHLVEDDAAVAAAPSAATGAPGVTMRTGQNRSACLNSVRCGHMPTGLAPDRPRSAHAQPSSAAATSGPSEGEASSARRIGESLAQK